MGTTEDKHVQSSREGNFIKIFETPTTSFTLCRDSGDTLRMTFLADINMTAIRRLTFNRGLGRFRTKEIRGAVWWTGESCHVAFKSTFCTTIFSSVARVRIAVIGGRSMFFSTPWEFREPDGQKKSNISHGPSPSERSAPGRQKRPALQSATESLGTNRPKPSVDPGAHQNPAY